MARSLWLGGGGAVGGLGFGRWSLVGWWAGGLGGWGGGAVLGQVLLAGVCVCGWGGEGVGDGGWGLWLQYDCWWGWA